MFYPVSVSAPDDPPAPYGWYENRVWRPNSRAVSDGIEYAGAAYAAAPWDGPASQRFMDDATARQEASR